MPRTTQKLKRDRLALRLARIGGHAHHAASNVVSAQAALNRAVDDLEVKRGIADGLQAAVDGVKDELRASYRHDGLPLPAGLAPLESELAEEFRKPEIPEA